MAYPSPRIHHVSNIITNFHYFNFMMYFYKIFWIIYTCFITYIFYLMFRVRFKNKIPFLSMIFKINIFLKLLRRIIGNLFDCSIFYFFLVYYTEVLKKSHRMKLFFSFWLMKNYFYCYRIVVIFYFEYFFVLVFITSRSYVESRSVIFFLKLIEYLN